MRAVAPSPLLPVVVALVAAAPGCHRAAGGPPSTLDCRAACRARDLENAGVTLGPGGSQSCVCLKAEIVAGLTTLGKAGEVFGQLGLGRRPAPRRPLLDFPTPASRPAVHDPKLLERLRAGITRVSDTEFVIKRSVFDAAVADTALFARGARVVPAFAEGRPVGFKLFGIRPDSPYALLGVRNGDTVVSLAGEPVTTPDRALEAYARLRHATEVQVEILRRGQPLTLRYRAR